MRWNEMQGSESGWDRVFLMNQSYGGMVDGMLEKKWMDDHGMGFNNELMKHKKRLMI